MVKIARKTASKKADSGVTLSVPKRVSMPKAAVSISDLASAEHEYRLKHTTMPLFANMRHAMLHGFSIAGTDGYTREQAAKAANIDLRRCFWKRAGELIEYGYLEPVKVDGEQIKRKSDLDGEQGVWRITKAGQAQLKMWSSR